MAIPDERFNLAWYKTEVERLWRENEALREQNRRVPDIVRCGECKYFDRSRYKFGCQVAFNGEPGFMPRKPDNYCSRGERRESEGKSDGT